MTGGDWTSKSGDQGCGCNQSFSRRAIVETQWGDDWQGVNTVFAYVRAVPSGRIKRTNNSCDWCFETPG